MKRWMLEGRDHHPCPGPPGYEEKMNVLGMYWDCVYRIFRREDGYFASLFDTKLTEAHEDHRAEAQRSS